MKTYLKGVFPFISFELDGVDYIDKIKKYILNYVESYRNYAWIPLNLTNKEYKKMFLRFNKVVKKRTLCHQVFLYAEYSVGMTADLRMSMMLEVFETLANELEKRGDINYKVSQSNKKEIICAKCGYKIKYKVANNKKYFYDKLYAINTKYG